MFVTLFTQKCSLIYQYAYRERQSYESIGKSLQLAPAAINCSVEPFLIDTHDEFMDSRFVLFAVRFEQEIASSFWLI